jgi:hypothetical protein
MCIAQKSHFRGAPSNCLLFEGEGGGLPALPAIEIAIADGARLRSVGRLMVTDDQVRLAVRTAGAGRWRSLLDWGILVFATLYALLLIQQFYGLGILEVLPVDKERLLRGGEGVVRWKAPERYQTLLSETEARLWENGEPWRNRAKSNRDLKEAGPGWYRWVDGGLNFIPRREGDLQDSGVSYAVVTPWQAGPKFFWRGAVALMGLVLLRLWVAGARGTARPPFFARLESLPWEWVMAGLALLLVMRGLTGAQWATDHGFLVRGLPESDAMAWQALSASLAQGEGLRSVEGFEGQRPLYAVYVGGLMLVLGPGLGAAQVFNALAIVVAAAGMVVLGRLTGSVGAGLVMAGAVAASGPRLLYAHAVLSETAGLALGLLSLLAVWRAAWELRLRQSFAAGAVNGLAALASGATLFTIPIYGAILVLFPASRRTHWRTCLKLGVVYCLGAGVCLGGLMAYHKAVFGRAALSFNAAELLAGGANEAGQLDAGMFEQAGVAGVDLSNYVTRYEYFMERFREQVRADPAGYLGRVCGAASRATGLAQVREPGFAAVLALGLLVFGLWPALARGQWVSLLAAGALAAGWAVLQKDENSLPLPLVAAAALLAWRGARAPSARLVVWLLAGTVLSVMLLGGLTGNVATKRLWLAADWSLVGLLVLGARQFVLAAGSLGAQAMRAAGVPDWLAGDEEGRGAVPAALETPAFIPLAVSGALVFSGVTGAAVLARTLAGPPPLLAVTRDKASLAEMRDAALRLLPPDHPLAVTPESLSVMVGRRTGIETTLAAGEGSRHWLEIYAPRSYARWIAKIPPVDAAEPHLTVMGRGSLGTLPKNRPLLFVGAKTRVEDRLARRSIPLFEAVLAVPLELSKESWRLDAGAAVLFPPTPEALTAAGVSDQ